MEQKCTAREKLEALLLEAIESGKPIEITPEYWERKRRELVRRHDRDATGLD